MVLLFSHMSIPLSKTPKNPLPTVSPFQFVLLMLQLVFRSPVASLSPVKTLFDTKPAPFMASFSSKGPNTVTPEILKVRFFQFFNNGVRI